MKLTLNYCHQAIAMVAIFPKPKTFYPFTLGCIEIDLPMALPQDINTISKNI